MRRVPLAALAASPLIVACLAAPGSLAAQAEFATPVPRGVLRVNFTPVWLQYDHFFGYHTPGYPDGAAVPLALDFNAESLGVASLPFLGTYQDQLQKATGLGTFSLNLGRVVTQLNASIRTLPIGLEYGLSRWLSIGVTVPIVHSRVDVNFVVDSAAAKRGNVGWNPGFLDPTTIAHFRGQMDSALAALQQLAASGPPALRAQAQADLALLRTFRALADTPFLPRDTTAAGDSIRTRLASAEAGYGQLAAQYADSGITLPPLTDTLALANAALTRADLERLFSDSTLPVAADTLGTIVKTGIGDITAHATLQLADGAHYRGQLVVTTRFPTGAAPSANTFLDLGTGTHQFGVEVALANDLLLGSHFLIHGVARVGGARADQIPMRVTPPDLPLAPLAQLATIKRTPASYVGLELAPTWQMDDAFSVRVDYSYFNQGATRHSYVDPADSARVGLPASVLDEGTGARLTRIGGGVTFSTLSRYEAGHASLPYSLTVTYDNTVSGRGGRVPQASLFRIQLRVYIRLFK
jgi:hypothetical protein